MKIILWPSFHVLFALILQQLQTVRADDIAVLYAMEADARELLVASSGVPATVPVKGRRLITATIGKHKVHLMRMGSGAVESAVSAERLLNAVRADTVVTIGPAGSLKPEHTPPGSWVEITGVVPYQKAASHDGGSSAAGVSEDSWTPASHGLPFDPGVRTNLPARKAASGEAFVSSAESRDRLAHHTGCDVVEMNLFGIRTALHDHKVRQVHIRIVSDRADERAVEEFRRFLERYDGEGGRVLAAWIRNLPVDPRRPEAHEGLRGMLEERKPDDRIHDHQAKP